MTPSDPLITTEIRECRHCHAAICSHVGEWITFLESCFDARWLEVKATEYDVIPVNHRPCIESDPGKET